jgi:hypothetical protein
MMDLNFGEAGDGFTECLVICYQDHTLADRRCVLQG